MKSRAAGTEKVRPTWWLRASATLGILATWLQVSAFPLDFPATRGFEAEGVVNYSTYSATGQLQGVELGGQGSAEKLAFTYRPSLTPGGDDEGYLATVTDPAGGTTTFDYDAAGNPTLVTRTGGRSAEVVRATYDAWDRPYQTTVGQGLGGLTVKRRYDLSGRLRELSRYQSGVGWVTTKITYTERDQVETVTDDQVAGPDGGLHDDVVTRTNVYDGLTGLLKTVETPAGRNLSYLRDTAGRVEAVELEPANGQVEPTRLLRSFDEMGRVAFASDGHDGWTVATYNRLGQLESERAADGAVVSYAYDAAGDLDRSTYNRLGGNRETSFDLTSYGAVKETTEHGVAGGPRTTTLGRDSRGRLRTVHRSGLQKLAVDYDPTTGRPELVTDADGGTTTFEFSFANLEPDVVTTREAHAGPVRRSELGYDNRNRMTTVIRNDGFRLYRSLDEVGNVLRQDLSGRFPDTTTYDWDGWSRLRRETRLSAGTQTTVGYDLGGFPRWQTLTSDQGAQTTTFEPDAQGNLKARTLPGSSTEELFYHPDSTVSLYKSRLLNSEGVRLEIGYGYDKGNRLLESWVNNPDDFADPITGLAPPADLGDAYDYDGLGRLLLHGRRVDDHAGTGEPVLDAASRVDYGYAAGDPRPLPATEGVGLWASLWPDSPQMTRGWDVHDRLQSLHGPGTSTAVDSFLYDLLDHRTDVLTPGESFNASYRWGGDRYLGHQAGQLTQTRAYTPTGLLDTLTATWSEAPLGGFAFEWEEGANVKRARSVQPEGELLDALGWEWEVDAVQRLTAATSGELKWSYGIEGADDLLTLVNHLGELETRTPGHNGRVEAIERTTADGLATEALAYDSVGRRISDARHAFTWSWRGELATVTATASGDQVSYTHDAEGRLLTRTHTNQAGAFLDKRAFIWNGWERLAQVGLNHQDEPLWQVEELPGPVGLDDTPQLRVTTHMHPSDSAPETVRVFDLVRDEMGTVVAVLEDVEGADPLPLKARILYDPYGQAHVEVGPELRTIEHDPTLTVVNGTPQGPTATGPEDDPIDGIAGSLVITTSIELDATTLTTGLTLERWDEAAGAFVPLGPTELAVAAENETTHVMPVAAWREGARYRLTLSSTITDTYGRRFVEPTAGSVFTFVIPAEVTGLHDPLPGLPVVEPLIFDSAQAAAATLDCRATLATSFEPCFPGGLNLLFQGAWTDPTSGIAHHRHRWYEARTQAWLSTDPEGSVDSDNLYAPFAWGPQAATDPMGLEAICTSGIDVCTEVEPGSSSAAILGVGDALYAMTVGQIRTPEETSRITLIMLFDALHGFKVARASIWQGVAGNANRFWDCMDAGNARCAAEAFTELGLTAFFAVKGAQAGVAKSLSSMPGVQSRWFATSEGPVLVVITANAQAAGAVEGTLADAGLAAAGVFYSGIESVDKGKEGERQAGIAGRKQTIPSKSGTRRFRVPDELTEVSLREIKNVAKQSNTAQLRDFLSHCQQEGLTFILETRPTTKISGPLQDLIDQGLIEHRYIGE